jgi:hypothetical protein
MYQSGDTVHVARRSGSLETARKIARKLTAEYQAGMQRYGGSSGGYRVIAWGTTDRTISGYSLDRIANAK